jgi:hypothetical protein
MLMPMPHKSRPFPLAPKDVTSSNDSTLHALQYLSQMGPEAARNLQSSDDFPVHTYLNPGTTTDCCLMLLVAQVNISCRYPISFERPWCLLDFCIVCYIFPLHHFRSDRLLRVGWTFSFEISATSLLISPHANDTVRLNRNKQIRFRNPSSALTTTHKNGLCYHSTAHAPLLGLFALNIS